MTQNTFNLRSAFLRGSAWNLLGMGSGQILRFIKNLILTRLLAPETYGVMAIVWTFMYAINMLTDAGLEAAALRHPRGEEQSFLNTVWTVKVVRGVLLFVVACVIAYPVSVIYKVPDLVWLIPVAAIVSLIDGFSSTNAYRLKRQMNFRALSIIEAVNEILMAIITLAWARYAPGYMALLGGALVGAVFHVVCTHTVIPGMRNRFDWDRTASRELFHFGKWVFFSSSVYLLYSQGDRMLLGLYIEPALLGVYSVAIMMSEVGGGVVSRINSSVVYATLSRVQHDGVEKIKSVLKKIRLMFDAAFIYPIGILCAVSPWLIEHLYDKRYHAAGGMLQILCIRLAMATMLASSDSCLIAIGKPKFGLYQNICRAIWLLLSVPLGFQLYGFQGALIAIAGTEMGAMAVLWYGLAKERIFAPVNEIRSAAVALAGFASGLVFLRLQSMW
jgi:O-antigen/teichoic acid export membrane protein